MISFKAFLGEAQRTPERANKLASYLSARHEREGRIPSSTIYGPRIALKAPVRKSEAMVAAVRRGIKKHGVKNDKELFEKHGRDATIHPSKLKPMQGWVEHHEGKFMDYKLGDKRPVLVVHHKGEHRIYDGHHRWMRDKLMGNHTNIRVYDTGEK